VVLERYVLILVEGVVSNKPAAGWLLDGAIEALMEAYETEHPGENLKGEELMIALAQSGVTSDHSVSVAVFGLHAALTSLTHFASRGGNAMEQLDFLEACGETLVDMVAKPAMLQAASVIIRHPKEVH